MKCRDLLRLVVVGVCGTSATAFAQNGFEVPPPPPGVTAAGSQQNQTSNQPFLVQTPTTKLAGATNDYGVNQVQYTQDALPPPTYPSNTTANQGVPTYVPQQRSATAFVRDNQPPPRDGAIYQPVVEVQQTPMQRCIESRSRLYINYDFMIMRPHRRDQDFAIVDNNLNNVVNGEIESVDYDTDAGYRLGVGMNFRNGWFGEFSYTYFHSSNSRAINAPLNGSIFPTMTRPGVISEVLTSSASTAVDYDVWDVHFGRNIEVGDNTLFRVSAGPRFALIDQSMHARYDGIDADRASVNVPMSFEGAGLRAGGEGQWLIGRGWRMYGSAFGSLVAGEMNTRIVERDAAGALPITLVTEKYETVIPVLELSAGFGWQGRHLNVRLGYEMTSWFNLVDTPDFADDVNPGKILRRQSNFSLDGFVMRLGWTF